jgi:hypothetical protein
MNPERITGKRGLIFLIGFLVFLVGYISVFFEFEFFEFLKVIGALVSLFAIFKLRNAGPRTVAGVKNEDGLTYFLEQCGCPAFECYAFTFYAVQYPGIFDRNRCEIHQWLIAAATDVLSEATIFLYFSG